MKLNWSKNYKKKNKDVVESYSIEAPFNMSLHHHIYYDPDEWLFTCRDIDMMGIQLNTKDIDVAEEKAIDIIKDYVDNINKKYKELIGGYTDENKGS